ncbi:hypothetical protein [Nostoc sp.]
MSDRIEKIIEKLRVLAAELAEFLRQPLALLSTLIDEYEVY